MPARARARQRTRPSPASYARMRPSKVGTNTTFPATVVQPNGGDARCFAQSRRPVESSSAVTLPRCHVTGRSSQSSRQPHPSRSRRNTGRPRRRRPGRRRSLPASRLPEQAWTNWHGASRERASVVAMDTDDGRPAANVSLAIPRDHPASFAGADDEVAADDRRVLKVVVANVVRRHLVEPAQAPVARAEREQRVRVQRRARERSAVRQLRRAAPRQWVRGSGVERPVDERRRLPRAAAPRELRMRPRAPNRLEPPADRALSARRARRSRDGCPGRTPSSPCRRGRRRRAAPRRRSCRPVEGSRRDQSRCPSAASSAKTRSSVLPHGDPPCQRTRPLPMVVAKEEKAGFSRPLND